MRSLLVAAVVVLAVADTCLCAVWLLAEDGHVPHDAVAFKFRSKHAYFCQVQDANSGKIHTGTLNKGESVCHYEVHGHVKTATDYKVLVKSPTEHVKWQVSARDGRVPDGAVDCDDADVGRCFLGKSMYGDGICEKGLGKIDVDANTLHLVKRGKMHKCPYFAFVTIH